LGHPVKKQLIYNMSCCRKISQPTSNEHHRLIHNCSKQQREIRDNKAEKKQMTVIPAPEIERRHSDDVALRRPMWLSLIRRCFAVYMLDVHNDVVDKLLIVVFTQQTPCNVYAGISFTERTISLQQASLHPMFILASLDPSEQ